MKALAFPFATANAVPETIRALDLVQRAMLDRWEAMPVPSSFLVDAHGYLLAIYKGPVSVETLVFDRRGQLVDLTPTEFRLLRHLAGNPDRPFSRGALIVSA